jgi:hypothetical protein
MNRISIRRILLVLGVAALLVNLSCTSDDIPVTPGPPFPFNDIKLTTATSPTPFDTLTRGQHYTAQFKVAYTLDPLNAALLQKNSLSVNARVFIQTTDLKFPYISNNRSTTLTSFSGVITDSVGFTVPNNADFVSIEAGIDTIPSAYPFIVVNTDWEQFWYVK